MGPGGQDPPNTYLTGHSVSEERIISFQDQCQKYTYLTGHSMSEERIISFQDQCLEFLAQSSAQQTAKQQKLLTITRTDSHTRTPALTVQIQH